MAYDKIIPIKHRLDHCVDYVLNPDKTDLSQVLDNIGNPDKNTLPGGVAMLQTAIHCRLESANADMQATKSRWHKRGGVLGYHLIHSYAPGEVTPEQAHRLGVEFVNRLLQDKYEAVVSTHLDHEHIHCHILFNSVSFTDGKKYRDNFQAYYGDIRGISNEISRENDLSVIIPEGSGKSYAEWDAHRKGKTTVRSLVRQDIDAAIEMSFTYQSFLSNLKKRGYEIKTGPRYKHTAFKPPGSGYVRLDSLGDRYSEEAIKERLARARTGTTAPEATAEMPKELPRRYTVKSGSYKKRSHPKGFRRLYVYYLCFLGYPISPQKRKTIPFAIRKEVTKLHRYQKQFRLMQEYRIDSTDQLAMLSGALQADIDTMTSQRKELYRQKRQGFDVAEQIEAINQIMRQRRQKLKLCQQIEADIPHIQKQIRQSREPEQKQPEKQPKQTKKFSIYERGN